uniref:Interleukin-1 receptor type 2-like n=1 Tax=Gouania willdenowi TaxID=441366 RepID=A0A8C5DYC6_GOUWI
MIYLVMLFAVIIFGNADGRRPPLPPLPTKDGCLLVSPEVEVFRVEGEAVILHFQIFITKNVSTEDEAYLDKSRVQQHDKQMWFLPAEVSDSGEYTCTYRNNSFCIAGSITLHVFQSSSVDMDTLSYPVPVSVGEQLKFRCPSVGYFNATEEQIRWNKDHSTHQLGSESSFHQEEGRLLIPAVTRSHAGVYTCQLTVQINNQLYKVSRAILLQVQGCPQEVKILSAINKKKKLFYYFSAPEIKAPMIVSPLNGTIYERAHGSGLELMCLVLIECSMAESTVVTWLVNSQSLESSHLANHALQGGRRVTGVPGGCQIEQRLVVERITEEERRTGIKCVAQNKGGTREVVAWLQLEDSTFTWLLVALVAASCFFMVICVFLCMLFKPKKNKKMDYSLAKQGSTCSI